MYNIIILLLLTNKDYIIIRRPNDKIYYNECASCLRDLIIRIEILYTVYLIGGVHIIQFGVKGMTVSFARRMVCYLYYLQCRGGGLWDEPLLHNTKNNQMSITYYFKVFLLCHTQYNIYYNIYLFIFVYIHSILNTFLSIKLLVEINLIMGVRVFLYYIFKT